MYVEPGILSRLAKLAQQHLPDRRIALIADAAVAPVLAAGPAIAAAATAAARSATSANTVAAFFIESLPVGSVLC